MDIRFYHPFESNGFLSNFYESAFILDGRKWKTVEHYYQAQKFKGTPDEEKVLRCKTPAAAKRYASAQYHLWRLDWEDVKVDIMRKAVNAKFFQSDLLAKKLFATDQSLLIEDSRSDFFWGIGDGTGKNMLGKILMETRQILNKSPIRKD